MARIKGIGARESLWLSATGVWVEDSYLAGNFSQSEAERRVRITNANNRFLDPEDRVEATLVESK